MLYPLTFQPIFKERVWGGRKLERVYTKKLPPHCPIGESWEITDRPDDVSIITNGPLAGKDLNWLVRNHGEHLLGRACAIDRFPLLLKILDAQEKLSLQVHPPARIASSLHGEPKTEMWYVAAAEPGADLYAGLRHGVTRAGLEARLADGTVTECFHRIPVRPGDAMFVPSGRVHAIGSGCLIFEIQQNSDTTYRVFDWNRLGLDGKPRPLHIQESLRSIDFNDFEPALLNPGFKPRGDIEVRTLVETPFFAVDVFRQSGPSTFSPPSGNARIIALLQGALEIRCHSTVLSISPGDFVLLPACLASPALTACSPSEYLGVTIP